MVKISAFPKCWIEEISDGRMALLDWFDLAVGLECEGLELYERFLRSYEPAYLRSVRAEARARGMELPMFCASPDFTAPPEEQSREIENQKKKIRAAAELGAGYCRVLSGQQRPGLSEKEGLDRVERCITACIPEAEACGVRLVIENHYKDGYWLNPEFAMKRSVFMQILERIDSPWLGVQFDPSNAIVAGEDPLELLEQVADRVATMHASDRYIAEGSDARAVLNHLQERGYHPALRHGVVGRGLNDYPAICRRLRAAGFDGWIYIEDGINGMEEMRESVDYLKGLRRDYFSA